MSKENAILDEEKLYEDLTEPFDFDELERKLQDQLEEELADMQFLAEEKEKVGSPDNLGNMGNLLKNPEKYLMKDKTYYIMCQSGARSNRTTKILNKQGYQVINVAGGVGSKYQLTGSVG